MADDKTRAGADRKRSATEQAYDVRAWPRLPGCAPQQLQAAVGPMADAVRRYLERR